MEAIILKQDSSDWEDAWNWLGNHAINQGLEEPKVAKNVSESWQYMGSYLNKSILISEFRHRLHPKTNNIYRATYRHDSYNEANFEMRRNIK